MSDVVGEWPSADEHVVTGGPVVDPTTEGNEAEQENRRTHAPARESPAATPGGCGTHVGNRGQTTRRDDSKGWYQPPEMWYHRGGDDE